MADALSTPVDRRFSRRGGRRAKDAGPRPCPELKKHPTSGLAFCTWYANRKYHFRYFGKAGTPDADRRYRRFALEWATGTVAASIVAHGAHVADVVKLWIEHCVRTYTKYGRPTSEVHCNKSAMRHMAELYGDVPAAGFNTPMLRAVREAMIDEGWVRKTVNDNIARIIRAFGWAAGEQLVPQTVQHGLKLLEPLAAGRRDDVAEGEKVEPAPEEHIAAVLEGERLHPPPARRAVLVAMIRVQLYAGVRPGELCSLRPVDLDRSKVPWRYEVTEYNKMLHKDITRVVFFGPRARAEMSPLLVVCGDEENVFRFPPWRKGAPWTPVSVVNWLNGKISKHDTGKVVPPKDAIHERLVEDTRAEVAAALTEEAVKSARVTERTAELVALLARELELRANALAEEMSRSLANTDQHWSSIIAKAATILAIPNGATTDSNGAG